MRPAARRDAPSRRRRRGDSPHRRSVCTSAATPARASARHPRQAPGKIVSSGCVQPPAIAADLRSPRQPAHSGSTLSAGPNRPVATCTSRPRSTHCPASYSDARGAPTAGTPDWRVDRDQLGQPPTYRCAAGRSRSGSGCSTTSSAAASTCTAPWCSPGPHWPPRHRAPGRQGRGPAARCDDDGVRAAGCSCCWPRRATAPRSRAHAGTARPCGRWTPPRRNRLRPQHPDPVLRALRRRLSGLRVAALRAPVPDRPRRRRPRHPIVDHEGNVRPSGPVVKTPPILGHRPRAATASDAPAGSPAPALAT